MNTTPSECRFCRTEMRPGAVYCTECKKFQNWQRFLGFSSTVLALIIALMSVSSAVLPGLVDYFTPARTQLSLSVIEHRSGEFVLLAKNGGNRDIVLGAAQIEFRSVGRFTATLVAADRKIAAGQTREIALTHPAEDRETYAYALRHFYWADHDMPDAADMAPRHGNHIGIQAFGLEGCKFLTVVEIPERVFMSYLEFFFPDRRIIAEAFSAPEKWDNKSALLAKASRC